MFRLKTKTGYIIGGISAIAAGTLMTAGYMKWKDRTPSEQPTLEDTQPTSIYTLNPNKVTYIPPEPTLPNRPEQLDISVDTQSYFDSELDLHISW